MPSRDDRGTDGRPRSGRRAGERHAPGHRRRDGGRRDGGLPPRRTRRVRSRSRPPPARVTPTDLLRNRTHIAQVKASASHNVSALRHESFTDCGAHAHASSHSPWYFRRDSGLGRTTYCPRAPRRVIRCEQHPSETIGVGRLRSAGGIGRCACGEPGEPGPSHMGRVLLFFRPVEERRKRSRIVRPSLNGRRLGRVLGAALIAGGLSSASPAWPSATVTADPVGTRRRCRDAPLSRLPDHHAARRSAAAGEASSRARRTTSLRGQTRDSALAPDVATRQRSARARSAACIPATRSR